MATPTFTLPTSGSDPKRATKEGLESNINQIIQYLDNARIRGDAAQTTGLNFQGPWDASTELFPSENLDGGTIERGDFFWVSVEGTFGGETYLVNEPLVAVVDNPSTSDVNDWYHAPVDPSLLPLIDRLDTYPVTFDTVADFFTASLADIKKLANVDSGIVYAETKDGVGRYTVDLSQVAGFDLVNDVGVEFSFVAKKGQRLSLAAFNAKGDGSDETDALLSFAEYLRNNPATPAVIPPLTYEWDGSNLVCGDRMDIEGYGATLKLRAGTYSGNMYGLTNREIDVYGVAYSASTPFDNDCRVVGLTINGNYDNVTHTGSMAGVYFHQCNDIIVADVSCVNIPGETNGLPGLDFMYCSGAVVKNYRSSNTGRQGIIFYESSGSVEGGNIGYSRFREPILISTNSPVLYQGTHVDVRDVIMNNSQTTDGSQCVRFSGLASGSVRGCDLTGSSDVSGVYIVDSPRHDIIVDDNDMRLCKHPVLVVSDGPKHVTVSNNRYWSCVNGLRWVAAGSGTRLFLKDNFGSGFTGSPLYVGFCENVDISGETYLGGDTTILIGSFRTLRFTGNLVSSMTAPTFALNIATKTGGTALPVVSNNVINGNTSDIITTNVDVLAEGNDLSNFVGTGIKLGRFGRAYVWASSAGKLYIKTSLPTSETDGTVVGTQTV